MPHRLLVTRRRNRIKHTPEVNGSPKIILGVTDPISLRLIRGHPEHLEGRGWEVHIVTGPRPERGPRSHVIPMARNPSPVRDLGALMRWWRLIGQVRPNVVMVGTPKAGLLGMVASAVRGVPNRIYLLRGLRLETVRGPMAVILWVLEFVSCRLAHSIVAVSDSLADEAVARRLCARARVSVLGSGSSNGVDVDEFSPPSLAARRRARASLGITNELACVIGFIGRVHRDKGILDLIAAVDGTSSPEQKILVIVGPLEDPSAIQALREIDSGLEVIVRPATEDVLGVYEALDVLCLPSEREGFPNVVLEAAACGLPAVVSDATGCVDSVVHDVTGLIYARDRPGHLAEAIDTLVADPSLRKQYGLNARARMEHEFSRQVVWANYDRYLAR